MRKNFVFLFMFMVMGMNTYSSILEVNSQAGMLRKNVEDVAGNYLAVESLKLKGVINSDDLLTLRRMAGLDSLYESSTVGKLAILDLSEVRISAGGKKYCETHEAVDDVVADYWFWKSPTLVDVKLPTSAVRMGVSAFDACKKLERIEFNSGLESLGNYAFMGCSALEMVELPASVKAIGKGAFKDCSSLLEVYMPGDIERLESQTFHSCTSLLYVELSNALKVIADQVFMQCSSLSDVIVPEGVESLGGHSFRKCSAMKTVVLPKTLKSIETSGFDGCTNLETIYCRAEMPPTVGNYAFLNVPVSSCALYVPEESLYFYKNNASWKVFTNLLATSLETNRESRNITFAKQNGFVKIDSQDKQIKWIEVYSASGQIVSKHKIDGNSAVLELKDEKIYIVKVLMENNDFDVLKI